MADHKPRVPFLLYDGTLRLAQKASHGMTAWTGGLIGLASRQSEQPEMPAARTADTAPTDASTPALATALDEKARAAIAEHAGEPGSVTRGLELNEKGEPVPPEEERGAEPFKPQVGP